jgi:hypothetical protein
MSSYGGESNLNTNSTGDTGASIPIHTPEEELGLNSNGDRLEFFSIFHPEGGTGSTQWGHLQFVAVKFISEHCIRDTSRFIEADALRDALSKESGQAIDARQLGRVLKSRGIIRVRRRRKYQRYYAYLGLTFKPGSCYAIGATNGDTRKTSGSTSHDQKTTASGDTYNLSTDTYTPKKSEIGYVWLEPD